MTVMETPDLIGLREERCLGLSDLSYRKADTGDNLVIEGYASVFDHPYDIMGGPQALGGWSEVVTRRAFDASLAKNPDVPLLLNHEPGQGPLARTKWGTLQLSTDKRGLRMRAHLDRRSQRVQELEISLERRDLDEMSFAFRTERDNWNEDRTERKLLEVNIHKGDVSIVNYGANDATTVGIRTVDDALELLSTLPPSAFAEVRGERLSAVAARLMAVTTVTTKSPRVGISVHSDPRIP